MLSGTVARATGWTFSSDVPSPCYAYLYALHRLLHSDLLSAKQKAPGTAICNVIEIDLVVFSMRQTFTGLLLIPAGRGVLC